MGFSFTYENVVAMELLKSRLGDLSNDQLILSLLLILLSSKGLGVDDPIFVEAYNRLPEEIRMWFDGR